MTIKKWFGVSVLVGLIAVGTFAYHPALAATEGSSLDVFKSPDSPVGTIARGTFTDVAMFSIISEDNKKSDVAIVTFTSIGLPATLASYDATLFRLYDRDNNVVIPADTSLDVAGDTVFFERIPKGLLALSPGQERHIALQITTTRRKLWPDNTSMHWYMSDIFPYSRTSDKEGDYVNLNGMPAVANVVTIGQPTSEEVTIKRLRYVIGQLMNVIINLINSQ